MFPRVFRSGRRPLFLGVVATALVLASTLAIVPATAVGTCDSGQMPDVFPVANMTQGLTGTGWTVVQGTTPVSFDVEVLGVEHNLILPGHDFVLVKLSGPVIDQNGFAAGMSGSPVYFQNKLAGAMAYGIYGDDTLGGMTPAEDMVKLFNNPEATSASSYPQRIALPTSLRRAAARSEGRAVSAAPRTATAMPSPLGISGLNDRAFSKFSKMVKKLKLNVIPFQAQAVPNDQTVSSAPLQPGESYSAVISTGDLSSFAIGTETARCGDLTIAFGHPFTFAGPTTFGLNGANILTTIHDQSHQFSYKWGDATEPRGTIDQDRFEGVRGIDGAYPAVIPITSLVDNPDLGQSRSGQTDLIRSEFLPDYAAFHLLANQDSMFDRVGDGTNTLSWEVDGQRADGSPFSLTRDNMFFSEYDISYASIFELYFDLYLLANNPFEDVTFTSVHEQASITDQHLDSRIDKVEWATAQSPAYSTQRRISVRPGQVIHLHVTLLPDGSTTPGVRILNVRVPENFRGGELVVSGGGSSGGDIFFGPRRSSGVHSFDDLLSELANADHGNDLIAQLATGRRGGAGNVKVVKALSRVILGSKTFFVEIGGGSGGGGGVCSPKGPCGI